LLVESNHPSRRDDEKFVSHFASQRPSNPVARIFKLAANDFPSPWGEGRVEGERFN
jgi:hypothetical protein